MVFKPNYLWSSSFFSRFHARVSSNEPMIRRVVNIPVLVIKSWMFIIVVVYRGCINKTAHVVKLPNLRSIKRIEAR